MNKFKKNLGKIFSVLTALFSLFCIPCMIVPLLVGIGAGSLAAHAAIFTKSLLIIFIIFAVIGFLFTFKNHQNPIPLILSIIGGTTIYYFYFITYSMTGIRIGALFMVLTAISDMVFKKKCKICK